MVEFVEITEKTIRANYKADNGNVTGSVTYTNGKMRRATGSIRKDDELVANFNTSGSKVNIVDCDTSLMATVAGIADATIKELGEAYPQE